MVNIFEWLLRWRWVVLAVVAILLLLFVSGVARLKSTSDYRVYFSEVNPQLRTF